MDGLVTKEGVTRDLEAFKEAGLAGVLNFQIGGPQQMRIGNPDNAIGSENWKELLRWTLDECVSSVLSRFPSKVKRKSKSIHKNYIQYAASQ